MLEQVRRIVGESAVRADEEAIGLFGSDVTEEDPRKPLAVVRIPDVDSLAAVVRVARAGGVPLTPRVAGTNVGGLAIPAEGGLVLDLGAMDRIVDLNVDDRIAVLEPGVTFGRLHGVLSEIGEPLTIGYTLSPPEASVLANCLLDGLGNLSLRHGAMGEWVTGLEVVRSDGSLLRTGVWALGVPVPFARAPLPDLTGLFLSWQGTTGIVSKVAVELWPAPPFRERFFVLASDRESAFRTLPDLTTLDVLDDLGAVSWPAAKLLFGVHHPGPRDPAEPEIFLYLDLSAASAELLKAKRRAVVDALSRLSRRGARLEGPLDVATLVRIEPRLSKFADFPTRLDFLLDHPGGGLTWVGTYGPMSRIARACERGMEIVSARGVLPLIVARPMKGGHFAVLRFIQLFERASAAARKEVRALNEILSDALIEEGFVMYKTPPWAVTRYRPRFDPGFGRLVTEVQGLLDPERILNRGKLDLRS